MSEIWSNLLSPPPFYQFLLLPRHFEIQSYTQFMWCVMYEALNTNWRLSWGKKVLICDRIEASEQSNVEEKKKKVKQFQLSIFIVITGTSGETWWAYLFFYKSTNLFVSFLSVEIKWRGLWSTIECVELSALVLKESAIFHLSSITRFSWEKDKWCP